MKESQKMIVVLTVITLISGATLGFLKDLTDQPIAYQKLKYVKGPAVREVLAPFDNDPIRDARTDIAFSTSQGDESRYTLFPARRAGRLAAVAFEVSGKGYGGDLAIMLGVDLDSKSLTGIRLVEHSETPGLGARATEPHFTDQFAGLSGSKVALSTDGGKVEALSGASITSNGVVDAVHAGLEFFDRHQTEILAALQQPSAPSTQEASP